MPTVVKRKIDAIKGKGRLLEEEELESLEKEGYAGATDSAVALAPVGMKMDAAPAINDNQGGARENRRWDEEQARRLAEEEERFALEMEMAGQAEDGDEREEVAAAIQGKRVMLEEVEDEDL